MINFVFTNSIQVGIKFFFSSTGPYISIQQLCLIFEIPRTKGKFGNCNFLKCYLTCCIAIRCMQIVKSYQSIHTSFTYEWTFGNRGMKFHSWLVTHQDPGITSAILGFTTSPKKDAPNLGLFPIFCFFLKFPGTSYWLVPDFDTHVKFWLLSDLTDGTDLSNRVRLQDKIDSREKDWYQGNWKFSYYHTLGSM